MAPSATPVTCGFTGGSSWPFGMVIVNGLIVAIAGSAMLSAITTSPTAGVERLIGRLADWPGPTTGTTPMFTTWFDTDTPTVAGV